MSEGGREFDDLVDDAYHRSPVALFRYLDIAILGPYEGDCFAFLTDLKIRLQDYGF